MEKYNVIIEPIAEEDLIEILTYITTTLHETDIAKQIYFLIRTQILTLELFPFRYAHIIEEPYRTMGIRKIPVKNYIIFYFVDEEEKDVHVFRILYNRREWKNLI
ncbi:MAG: type II toxin-antitoxin system RelE/ParE family toxin [Bacilli bacterium]